MKPLEIFGMALTGLFWACCLLSFSISILSSDYKKRDNAGGACIAAFIIAAFSTLLLFGAMSR